MERTITRRFCLERVFPLSLSLSLRFFRRLILARPIECFWQVFLNGLRTNWAWKVRFVLFLVCFRSWDNLGNSDDDQTSGFGRNRNLFSKTHTTAKTQSRFPPLIMMGPLMTSLSLTHTRPHTHSLSHTHAHALSLTRTLALSLSLLSTKTHTKCYTLPSCSDPTKHSIRTSVAGAATVARSSSCPNARTQTGNLLTSSKSRTI